MRSKTSVHCSSNTNKKQKIHKKFKYWHHRFLCYTAPYYSLECEGFIWHSNLVYFSFVCYKSSSFTPEVAGKSNSKQLLINAVTLRMVLHPHTSSTRKRSSISEWMSKRLEINHEQYIFPVFLPPQYES